MYRTKIDEFFARRNESPGCKAKLLDVSSWSTTPRLTWEVLELIVRRLHGVVAIPQSLLTFEGPRTFFITDDDIMDTLDFASLVRAYPLIHNETPPKGVSRHALAVVVVAASGIRPRAMLLPALDDRSVETFMLLHGRPAAEFFQLRAEARPSSEPSASILRGELMKAPGAHIEDVIARVAGRLDRDLAELPHKYGLAIKQRRP